MAESYDRNILTADFSPSLPKLLAISQFSSIFAAYHPTDLRVLEIGVRRDRAGTGGSAAAGVRNWAS